VTAITRAAMAQRVRRELGDFPWETTGSAASSSSVIAVVLGTDWAEGDIGEFEDDGEEFRVRSISSNDLTCVRGYNGTTAATQAASSRILKSPRYGLIEIQNAVEGVIQDLPYPKVYKKVSDTIAPAPATTLWYDVGTTGNARALIRVVQQYGSGNEIVGFFGVRHAAPRVVFERNLPTAIVAAGTGVMFPDGFYHATNTVAIDFAAKITDAGTTSYDDLNEGDVVTEAVIYGAVSFLEAALENKKPRKPRGDRETLRGASLYQRKYEESLNRAQVELRETIPLMRRSSTSRVA